MRRFLAAVSDVFHDRSHFDFMGRRRVFFAISGVIILVSLGSLFTRGLNLGIDFEGGTAWQVTARERTPEVAEIRDVLRPLGEEGAKVSILGRTSIRVQSIITDADAVDSVSAALAEYAGVPASEVSIQTVGPTFGEEVTDKALRALFVFVVAVLAYLALRFEPKMAGAAIVALAHDVLITVGVYSLTGFEVTPATVIAVLTILGYSLYDTVVVFDKVKENVDAMGTGGSRTYSAVVNDALNQVVMRSLNTSFTTLIPVGSLLVIGSEVLGAVAIREFALALFVGLLAGTYSSIFTASPVLCVWKEREPRYRSLRRRIENRRTPARGPRARVPAPPPRPAETAEPEADARAGGVLVADRPDVADDAAADVTAADGGARDDGVPADAPGDDGERQEPSAPRDRPVVDHDAIVRPKPRKPRRKKRR